MTGSENKELFMTGMDCSPGVTGEFAEALGMERVI